MSNTNNQNVSKFATGDRVFTKVGPGKILSVRACPIGGPGSKVIVTYLIKLENQRQPLDFVESEVWKGFV